MPVIAMTHEIGSLGDCVAARLAVRLGIEFADQLFLEDRIVDRLECCKSLFSHHGIDRRQLVAGRRDFGRVRPAQDPRCRDVASSVIARLAMDEIRELAAYGNVLLKGWGAPTVLRNCPHIFRIRVTAPIDVRLAIMAARAGSCDERALRNTIETSDACLAGNLEPALGPGWRTGDDYHLVLGMQALTADDAVTLLADYVKAAIRRDQHLLEAPVMPRRVTTWDAAKSPGSDLASISRAEQVLFGSH